MTKRTGGKVGYAFLPVPEVLPREWMRQSYLARALGKDLFSMGRGKPIEVGADWPVDVCRQLEIEGKERPNVVRALRRLEAAGLLSFDGRLLAVCRMSAGSLPAVCEVSDGSLRSGSAENHSPPISQNRIEEIKEERGDAGACEVVPVRRAEGTKSGKARFWDIYHRLVCRSAPFAPPSGAVLDAVTACVAAVDAEAGASDGPAWDAAAKRLLAAWQADPWVAEHRPQLTHLSKQLHKFVLGAVAPKARAGADEHRPGFRVIPEDNAVAKLDRAAIELADVDTEALARAAVADFKLKLMRKAI